MAIDRIGQAGAAGQGGELDDVVGDEAMGGRGVASALLNFMLEDARQTGFKIVPVCPYVRGQYAKHPEWSDLFTTRPGEDP